MITRDVTLVFYSMCFMFDGYFLLLILVFFVTVSNVKHIYKIDKMTISEKNTAFDMLLSRLFLQHGVLTFPLTLQRCSKYKWQSVNNKKEGFFNKFSSFYSFFISNPEQSERSW